MFQEVLNGEQYSPHGLGTTCPSSCSCFCWDGTWTRTGDGHSWCGLRWESDFRFSLPCLFSLQPSAFLPAQQRSSSRGTPLSTPSSLIQPECIISSWGGFILAHVCHTVCPVQGASMLPISPAAPLLPCWQQQQGFQGGLAWLDPWGSRGAPSSCCLS